jgi:hypothetical protein
VGAAVNTTSTARQARRACVLLVPPPCWLHGSTLSDSEKKIHQSWGGDDGPTEFRVEEAATVDAAVESNNDWAGEAANDWTGGATNDWAGGATSDWAGGATDDWGAAAPAADDQWATPVAAPETAAAEADTTDKVGGEREQRRGRDREPDEDDTTLTLTQYLAQKKEKESVPKLEGVRKANEGADDTIWKDAIPLKKEESALFVGKVRLSSIYRTFGRIINVHSRPSRPIRHVPRRRRRYFSRSTLTSSVLPGVDEAVAVTEVIGPSAAAAVVVADQDVPTALRPSMSMTRPLSRHCLDLFCPSQPTYHCPVLAYHSGLIFATQFVHHKKPKCRFMTRC